MKIIGIESSSIAASCAITDNQDLLGEYTLNHKLTHSEKLMPLLENLMGSLDLSIDDIDLIAIDDGPGSYTGLRIGASIAKGLSFKRNIPLINIASTIALANNIKIDNLPIAVLIDARSNRVFYAVYKRIEGKLITLLEPNAATIEDILDKLKQSYESIYFVGDGSKKYTEKINEKFGQNAYISSSYENIIKAYSLCELGFYQYNNGNYISSNDFIPNYLRPSQAERNLFKE